MQKFILIIISSVILVSFCYAQTTDSVLVWSDTSWKVTDVAPAGDWTSLNFDDGGWESSTSPAPYADAVPEDWQPYEWMWHSSSSHDVYFRKIINLNSPIDSVFFRIMVDDAYELYINEVLVYQNTSCPGTERDTLDINNYLVSGKNIFAFKAIDCVGRRGVLLESIFYSQTGGLVGFYPFNGNANNIMNSGFDGIITGATFTTDRFGNENQAIYFDENAKIECGDANFLDYAASATISAWIKYSSLSSTYIPFVTKGGIAEHENYGFATSENGIRIEFGGDNNQTSVASINNFFNDGNWHFFVAILNNTIPEIYVDGQLRSIIGTSNVSLIKNTTDQLTFGYNIRSTGENYYNGFLDDVKIYNRAITQTEIDSLYHEGGWPFNEEADIYWSEVEPYLFDHHSTAITQIDGIVYMIDGGSTSGNYNFKKCEKYNPASNTWTEIQDVPEGKAQNFDIGIANGRIYTVGGEGPSAGSWSNKIYEYDPSTDSWTQKNNWTNPRRDIAIAEYDNKIYVAGGMPGYSSTSNMFEVYEPVTDQWTELNAIPKSLAQSRIETIGNKIYLFGGFENYNDPGNIGKWVYEYSILSDSWIRLGDMPGIRKKPSVTSYNNKIFFIGGRDSLDNYINDVWTFNPIENKWETLKSSNLIKAELSHNHTVIVNGKIYFAGSRIFGSDQFVKSFQVGTLEELSGEISISIDDLIKVETDTALIPINITFPENEDFYSAEISIKGFQGLVDYNSIVLDETIMGDAGWEVITNNTDSLLISASAGSSAISGEGILFYLKLYIHASTTTSYVPINITKAIFNDGTNPVNIDNGSFLIMDNFIYGDVNLDDLVQAFDASFILRYLVDDIDLNSEQLVRANVSSDLEVSSLDATLILQYVAELVDSLPVNTETPEFDPTGTIDSYNVSESQDDIVDISLNISNGSNIYSFYSQFSYDNEILEFEEVISSEHLDDFLIESNGQNGILKISGAGKLSDGDNGEFITLRFSKLSSEDINTNIIFQKLRWNEAEILNNPLIIDVVTSVSNNSLNIPNDFELSQNYPNPFNPSTTIRFALPFSSKVKLDIYNVLGENVAKLINGNLNAGFHEYNWNASNLSSGIYFYKINAEATSEAEHFIEVKKLILIK